MDGLAVKAAAPDMENDSPLWEELGELVVDALDMEAAVVRR